MNGLTVDGFPECGSFIVGKGVKERFSEGAFGVEILIWDIGGGGRTGMLVIMGIAMTPRVVAMTMNTVGGRWGVRAFRGREVGGGDVVRRFAFEAEGGG